MSSDLKKTQSELVIIIARREGRVWGGVGKVIKDLSFGVYLI